MTSTIDANVLLYASDGHNPLRDRALGFLGELATDPSMVYLFWPALFSEVDPRVVALRRRMSKVLKDYAIDSMENQGLHSWRCVPPYDRSPCRHFDDLLDSLVASVEEAASDS